MRRMVRLGNKTYEFISKNQSAAHDETLSFSNKKVALSFLSRFIIKPSSMLAFRAILSEEYYSMAVSKLKNQQVIELLATRLYLGNIEVTKPRIQEVVSRPMASSKAIVLPFVRSSSAVKKPSKSSVDPALIAQAETLKQASATATPFCSQ